MRAPAGSSAVPASAAAQAAVPATNSRLGRRYSGRSPRAASSHSTAKIANNTAAAMANAAPRAPPAWEMKAPIATSTRICSRNVLRPRASSWPCSSWWRLPLSQAIHTSVNTTANSPSPRHVRCPARWWAAWATSTTVARS
jgi:hypothetical protein